MREGILDGWSAPSNLLVFVQSSRLPRELGSWTLLLIGVGDLREQELARLQMLVDMLEDGEQSSVSTSQALDLRSAEGRLRRLLGEDLESMPTQRQDKSRLFEVRCLACVGVGFQRVRKGGGALGSKGGR